MEVEELQCLPLTVPLSTPFAASWSEDDSVSIMTPKGVYILMLQPIPCELLPLFNFKRSWIQAPLGTPTADLGINPNNFIHKLEKEDYYETVAEYSLSPNLENTEDAPPHPTQVAWSDKDMLAYNRCIFGSLTNYGLVSLYILRNSQWIVILNLSEEIIKLYEKDWDKHPSSPYDQFFALKERVSQVKSATICWSSKFGRVNEWYSYFLTGQANGDILVWKIPSFVNEEFHSEPKYICRFNVNSKRMSTLNWFSISSTKGMITVGDQKGIIKLYEVILDPMDSDKFLVRYLLDIWPENDNISVRKVECIGNGSNLKDRLFVAFKGNSLVIMSVSDNGELLDKTSRHMGGFNIVGCVHINENSMMLSTQQGNIIKVKISKSFNNKIDLNVVEIKSNIDMSEKLCFGLATSSNRMIWLMANSIYKPHDHLVLREPTNIILFTLNSNSDPLAVLRNNPSKSLTTYWDCLELFRVFLTRGKELQVDVNTENLSSLTMYELCCNLWKLTIRSKVESQENECPAEMKALLKRIEDAIILKRTHQVLQNLLSADESTLTNEQIMSFGLYYKWLKNYIDEYSESDKRVFQSLLSSLENKVSFLASIPEEKCALCAENVKMKSWRNAECDKVLPKEGNKTSGHCLSRCSLSLIQCLDLPYRICYICGALAREKLTHEEVPVCVFCNGRMCVDDRVRC